MARKPGPTLALLGQFQKAFDHFNRTLFDPQLPPTMIVWTRRKRVYGHFAPERWRNISKDQLHEIAMNPVHFLHRPDRETLSTLVHEMVHLQQAISGKPSRNGYHNREWAELMRAIGLEPSDTAAPGGKPTGQKVSHYIIPGGAFDRAADRLLNRGFKFDWAAVEINAPKSRQSSKSAYQCEGCGAKVWGKPGLRIGCGDCTADAMGRWIAFEPLP